MSQLSTLLWRLIWVGAGAIIAIAAALLIVRVVRRRGDRPVAPGSFTLRQVVELRERGELSEIEYVQLRNVVLSRLPDRPDFTLHELRQMRQRGEVSEREYELVRAVMLARLRANGRSSADRDS